MILNAEKDGLEALYKPYVVKILQFIWFKPAYVGNGVSNSEICTWYNKYAQEHNMKKISKSSIINATIALEQQGILGSYEVSGKGGYRKMYYQNMSPQIFAMTMKEVFTEKLEEMFTGPWWKPQSSASMVSN